MIFRKTLDDASSSARVDVNVNFLAHLNQSWANVQNHHPNYLTPRFNSDKIFGIKHYAGEVFSEFCQNMLIFHQIYISLEFHDSIVQVYYSIEGFSEKNRDSTNHDMRDIMARSKNPLLRCMVEEACKSEIVNALSASLSSKDKKVVGKVHSSKERKSVTNKLKEDSISKQFIQSLKQLYETLDNTHPHYVRCVKPNSQKLPECLNAYDTLDQLKNAGMMETIRIRQEG